jgi:hypothetical protein
MNINQRAKMYKSLLSEFSLKMLIRELETKGTTEGREMAKALKSGSERS